MRRADRLFQITQILRGRRLTTAAQLAERLAVSERTIYRDVRELGLSGVPIEGEAGVGYRLRPGFDLPPLMFTPDELSALALGASMVQAWASGALGQHAAAAHEKIAAALSPALRARLENAALHAPSFGPRPELDALEPLRLAIDARRRLHFSYLSLGGQTSSRWVWPLGLFFWGQAWTLGGWCELRQDFRNFRVDRISALHVLSENYPEQAGRRLPDLLRAYCTQSAPA